MANPNLVRKPALDGSTTGEVSKADILNTNLGSQNYIINGDMAISQRGSSFPAIANLTYNIDRYLYQKQGTIVHTVTRDTDVPTLAQASVIHSASMRLNVTTAQASFPTAFDFVSMSQRIEGSNYAQFAQKTFTVSFWVKSSVTGIYSCVARNSNADRSCVMEYTINAANTWEYKAVTFPAPPSSGTWDYASGIGIGISWTLGINASFTTAAGAWTAGNFLGSPNQVNAVATIGNDFRITGIMLNAGSSAAPFSRFGKSIDAEYAACCRYYEVLNVSAWPDGTNANIKLVNGGFNAAKRVAPSCSSIGVIDSINGGGGAFTFVAHASGSPTWLAVVVNVASGATAGRNMRGTAEADAEL